MRWMMCVLSGLLLAAAWASAEPIEGPVRAVVLGVDGKTLTVGPGSDGGMTVGMALRVFRGSRAESKGSQWIGTVKVVTVQKRSATCELTDGEARVTDFVISDPIPLPDAVRLPEADHTQRPKPVAPTAKQIEVRLRPLAEKPGKEIVSFGVPFPPGAISDAAELTVFDGETELATVQKRLAVWRVDAKPGTPRSILVQFELDFSDGKQKSVTVRWDRPRTRKRETLVPIHQLLVRKTAEITVDKKPATAAYEEPRVLAILPAKWLCDSWVAGPQIPAAQNRWIPAYETHQMKLFRGFEYRNSYGHLIAKIGPGEKDRSQDSVTLSGYFAEHQLDRTVLLYRLALRTGDAKVWLHAFRHATFYRNQIGTEADGKFRGMLKLKTSYADPKYSYAEGIGVHYLLTGDERVLGTIEDISRGWDARAGHLKNGYTKKPSFWTERHFGFAWSAKLHAYQLTGEAQYLADAKHFCDLLYAMQFAPADGHPVDGSWRHSSAHYGEGGKVLGSSVWMSALLVDTVFQHWLLTGEPRCPKMLAAYAEFAERNGLKWKAWHKTRTKWAEPWYFASSIKGSWGEGGEAAHNIETGYVLLMGYYFRRDPRYLYWGNYLMRWAPWRVHPRMYNWCYRASPQAFWFLKEAGVSVEQTKALHVEERK